MGPVTHRKTHKVSLYFSLSPFVSLSLFFLSFYFRPYSYFYHTKQQSEGQGNEGEEKENNMFLNINLPQNSLHISRDSNILLTLIVMNVVM